MLFCSLLLFFDLIDLSYEQVLSPYTDVEVASERDRVTLSCNYTSSGNTLLWYRQYPKSAPQLLVMEYADITPGFTLNHDKNAKRMDLEISSAEVSDSAMYYCALRPTSGGFNQIIFGTGTKLIVYSREKHEPSYYTLNSSNTTACLATDFSAHKANSNSEVFNNTEATRVKGDSYYSQVALEKNCTKEDGSEKCEANWYFDTDAKINFLSLTILGLRILFLKTIVFNVLMTLRLWMS
nr:T-cell receptor alpha chain V region RL-5 precursor [Salmo salar]